MNLNKLRILKSKRSKDVLLVCYFGGFIAWGIYRMIIEWDEPRQEAHWGLTVSLVLLMVMVLIIGIMLAVKFKPSNWKKDPENPEVKVTEGMKIFE